MAASRYDYIKGSLKITYPDGDKTYTATNVMPAAGGVDTSDATAVASDIVTPKTAYTKDGKVTGSIPKYNGASEPASGASLLAQMVDGTLENVTASDLVGCTKIRSSMFDNVPLKTISIPDSVTSCLNIIHM